MLVCGEDLGMIPACVHPVMEELGLVGLRIQRMPCETDLEFGDPSTYPYMVVASPSSHDTSTTRGWWEQDAQRRVRYYSAVRMLAAGFLPSCAPPRQTPAPVVQVLGGEGLAPHECAPPIMQQIVRQHAESPAVLAIFPVQDILAMTAKYTTRPAEEEMINDPTNPQHYWYGRQQDPALRHWPPCSGNQSPLIGAGDIGCTSDWSSSARTRTFKHCCLTYSQHRSVALLVICKTQALFNRIRV